MGLQIAFVIALAVPGGVIGGDETVSRLPAAVSDSLVLAFVRQPTQGVVLTRLDRHSLEEVGPQLVIGEYHSAWSYSPDRTRLAVAMSAPGYGGRVAVRIVDAVRIVPLVDVVGPIAAEAVAWVTPERLVAGLQNGDVTVIDAGTGSILEAPRLPVPLEAHGGSQHATAVRGRVVIMAAPTPDAPAVLALTDATGELRVLAIPGVAWADRLPNTPGFAVDAQSMRAFVVTTAGLAVVDLETMQASTMRLDLLPDDCPAGETDVEIACHTVQRAAWLGHDTLAVWGTNFVGSWPSVQRVPAGVALVDTARSTVRTFRGVGRARRVGSRLMLYDGPYSPQGSSGSGLRALDPRGREVFAVLDGQTVARLEISGSLAYAQMADAVHVLDCSSGEVLHELAPRGWFEIVQ